MDEDRENLERLLEETCEQADIYHGSFQHMTKALEDFVIRRSVCLSVEKSIRYRYDGHNVLFYVFWRTTMPDQELGKSGPCKTEIRARAKAVVPAAREAMKALLQLKERRND